MKVNASAARKPKDAITDQFAKEQSNDNGDEIFAESVVGLICSHAKTMRAAMI